MRARWRAALLRIARVGSGNYMGACIRVACDWLAPEQCMTIDDVLSIAVACRADFGGACLAAACRFVGAAECGSWPVVTRIIRACRGNYDARCLSTVCTRSTSQCGTVDELVLTGRAYGNGE